MNIHFTVQVEKWMKSIMITVENERVIIYSYEVIISKLKVFNEHQFN